MREPSEETLRWAVRAVGGGVRVAAVTGLRECANPWLLRFEPAGRIEAAVLRLGDRTDPDHCRRFSTEVAAMRVAGDHLLPAARLIADDLDGAEAGGLAVLATVLPGDSRIPPVASTERLRGLGAAAAALQAVPLGPRAALPLRTRSIADVDFAARRREKGTTALLAAAGDRCTGLVDWDCAGAGSPGIDLSGARFDAALLFGLPAAEQVLEGWQRATGRRAEQLAYWDVVAVSCTLADMAFCVPVMHDQGRPDLDAGILGKRRDAFLSAALARLDAGER